MRFSIHRYAGRQTSSTLEADSGLLIVVQKVREGKECPLGRSLPRAYNLLHAYGGGAHTGLLRGLTHLGY